MCLLSTLLSILINYLYGEETFEEVSEPTGPCSVGFKRIWNKNDQHVLVFYPIPKRYIFRGEKPDYLIFGKKEELAHQRLIYGRKKGFDKA